MITTPVDLVSALPLYRDLSADELGEIVGGLRPVTIADGETLMRQGDQPDGAYFITAGTARVLTKLPGGGETLIAEVGPGSMLGELALIRATPRGATVRAQGPVEALFADRRYFRAALAQLRPVAIKVAQNLAAILAQRLHQQQDRICRHVDSQPEGTYFTSLPAMAETSADPGFDVRAFLPILPCFREFEPTDLDRIFDLATLLHAERGTPLDRDGPPKGWIVVRGAVMSYLPHAEKAHQLNVFGPGTFCAIDRLVEPSTLPVRHVARERVTLLALTEPAFRELFDGLDALSLRFVGAVNESLAALVARGGNHLTRLVGLTRLYRQREDSPDVAI